MSRAEKRRERETRFIAGCIVFCVLAGLAVVALSVLVSKADRANLCECPCPVGGAL